MKLCTVQSPVTSSLLGPNTSIFLCTLFSKIVKVYFSLNLRDEFSHPHKTEVMQRAELSLSSFLNSALDGSDGYLHNLAAETRGKNPRYALCRRQRRAGRFEEESGDGTPNCLTLSLVALQTTPFPLSTDIS